MHQSNCSTICEYFILSILTSVSFKYVFIPFLILPFYVLDLFSINSIMYLLVVHLFVHLFTHSLEYLFINFSIELLILLLSWFSKNLIPQLEKLHGSSNLLKNVPEDIGCCVNLQMLDLSWWEWEERWFLYCMWVCVCVCVSMCMQ